MNSIRLLGKFAQVYASTDGSIKVVNNYRWFHGDGYYSATFLVSDGAWIVVRVRDSYFDFFFEKYVEGKEVVQIEGKLCTEVSRGSGIVKNYIWIG